MLFQRAKSVHSTLSLKIKYTAISSMCYSCFYNLNQSPAYLKLSHPSAKPRQLPGMILKLAVLFAVVSAWFCSSVSSLVLQAFMFLLPEGQLRNVSFQWKRLAGNLGRLNFACRCSPVVGFIVTWNKFSSAISVKTDCVLQPHLSIYIFKDFIIEGLLNCLFHRISIMGKLGAWSLPVRNARD